MKKPPTTVDRPRRHLVGLLVTVGLLAAAALPATGSPTELDASFGVGGSLRTNFGGTYDWAYALAVQPDDMILAAGVSNASGTYDFALARYRPDGALDTTFGTEGMVTTDFGDSYDWAYALVLQPDRKIVLAGVSDVSGSKDFALARYNADGSLDRSFGEGGMAVNLRPLRSDPEGSVDHGFGEGGVTVKDLRPLSVDVVRSLALQPDGRLVAAGITYDDEVTLRPHGDFMVARYTPDGAPDPTFGINGVVTTDFEPESYDEPYALAVQPDGRIVLGGYSNSGGGYGVLFGADDLALARYLPNGLLDSDFGQDGKVTVDLGTLDEEIRALALDPGGRLVAGGFADGEKRGDLVLARFTPGGALDPRFGADGYTRTDLGSRSELLTTLALLGDGRIVAGGQVAPDAHGDFAVLRYGPDGRLDDTFGSGGLVRVDFGGREDRVQAVAVQRDAKVVAAGYSEDDFAVVRLRRGGALGGASAR